MKPEPEHPLAAPAPGLTHPWPEPPEGGTSILVAPGIRWIRMPLPFQLNHINLWLLDDEAGVTVVDTGIGLPPTRELWEQLFAGELAGRPLVRVLVTHFHPDHIGNADWLAQRFGVELWCPQAEWLMAHLAWQGMGGNDSEKRLNHYRRHGVPAAQAEAFRGLGNHYRKLVPSVAPSFRAVREGDVVTIGGRRWHAFTVMGHAPEHACLYCAETGVLIAGDQILPKISPNISVQAHEPDGDPLARYLASLKKLRAALPPDILVLPSHNLPFRGVHVRIDELAAHHHARCAEVIAACERLHSAAELMPVLFKRVLDRHQTGFALGEALAHVHYLIGEGELDRATGDDGVDRFLRKAA